MRRNKGEGSITEISKGKYKVTFTVGYDTSGKQKRRSYTASTKRECLDKIAEWKHELHLQPTTVMLNNRILLAEYMSHYLDYKKTQVKFSTYKAYVTASKYILKTNLRDIRLSKVTTRDINDMLIESSKTYSASARQQHKILLNDLFNLTVSEGLIPGNPMQGAMRVSRKRYTLDKDLPTSEQINRLLEAARALYKVSDDKTINKYLYHAIILALSTGMRRGEIVALRWDVIGSNSILVNKTAPVTREDANAPDTTIPKTSKSFRMLKVDPAVIDCLNKEIPRTGDYLFMSSKQDSHINPVALGACVKKLFRDVGMGDFHMHDLRHVYATTLLQRGVNVKIVSQRLGHSDVTITLGVYAHFVPEMDEEASLVMGANLLQE